MSSGDVTLQGLKCM